MLRATRKLFMLDVVMLGVVTRGAYWPKLGEAQVLGTIPIILI
jgi:hypothetical protein